MPPLAIYLVGGLVKSQEEGEGGEESNYIILLSSHPSHCSRIPLKQTLK